MEKRNLLSDYIEVTKQWEMSQTQDNNGDNLEQLLTIARHAINCALETEKELKELRAAANLVVGSALSAKEIHDLSRNDAIAYHTKFAKTVAALAKQLKVTS